MLIYLKIICLACICFFTTYLGFLKAKVFINRENSLINFLNALVMIKSKIEFTQEPLKNIFEEISYVIYHNEDNVFLNTLKIKNNNFYLRWEESINTTCENFDCEDKNIIKNFGKMLGKTDINGQIDEILFTKKLIESQIKKAEEDKIKNVKLYKTLGVCLGLFLCIVLI